MHTTHTNTRGFTIVELLIVIVVIGILAAITIVSFNGVSARAKTAKAQSNAEAIVKKAESYRTIIGTYPNIATDYSTTTDFSSSDSSTKLTGIAAVRGTDNAPDVDSSGNPGMTDVKNGDTSATPTYLMIYCLTSGIQTGIKVAYPDYPSNTVKWVRAGSSC